MGLPSSPPRPPHVGKAWQDQPIGIQKYRGVAIDLIRPSRGLTLPTPAASCTTVSAGDSASAQRGTSTSGGT
eukprot:scaffold102132_cov16-Tisochrysis_lutea.AAC.2